MKRPSTLTLILLVGALLMYISVVSITTALSPMSVPGLTMSDLTDRELSELTLDLFAKGLETQSDYLLECSADSVLRERIAIQWSELQAKGAAVRVRVTKETTPVTFVLHPAAWDSSIVDTSVATCEIRLLAGDSCLFRTSSQCRISRYGESWRVTEVPAIDSLCTALFEAGAWQ